MPRRTDIQGNREDPHAAGPTLLQRAFIWIYESELLALAEDAATWNVETGGDLFGLWNDTPIVYLATKAGPGAVRETAHFRLDVDYLRALSEQLDVDWGLRYLGDWHSHHRLGLKTPSTGDRQRIRRLAIRNDFASMAEFIITISGLYGAVERAEVHPYIYREAATGKPSRALLRLIPGCSPVREALITRKAFPEQMLDGWHRMEVDRVVYPPQATPADTEMTKTMMQPIADRVLQQAMTALAVASEGPIEHHQPGFGHILVASAGDSQYVAFALDRRWPFAVLEVDWIDRRAGTSKPLAIACEGVDARMHFGLVEIYDHAKSISGGRSITDADRRAVGTAQP